MNILKRRRFKINIENEKIRKEVLDFLSCDGCIYDCDSKECSINWMDKKNIKDYISYLENEIEEKDKKVKALEHKIKSMGKGEHSLMMSRKKWKYRYYKERKKGKK